MIPRVLEPEVMDTAEEAADYDSMDHSEVNRIFASDLLAAWGSPPGSGIPSSPSQILDVGTGTAQIPIELCRQGLAGTIVGVDLSEEMLAIGRCNVREAGLTRIELQKVDARRLPYEAGTFEIVMSNSIVHHIPEPADVLAEMVRVLAPGGLLFVRDLLRPETDADVEHLVATHAGSESPRQQQLFRQSLHAALTLEELREIASVVRIPGNAFVQNSDRHWTLAWRKG